MRNILLLNGNPKKHSFSIQLMEEYEIAAKKHAHVRRFNLSEMDFNPSLEHGYDNLQEMEPCLQEAQNSLSWANHLVIVSPIWWGGLPAKFKGMFDRTLLPNFAFKYENGTLEQKPLLKGKTARIILTMDAPEEFAHEQAQPVLGPVNTNPIGSVVPEKASIKARGEKFGESK